MRGLIQKLSERVSRIEILESAELLEEEAHYARKVGYELLRCTFTTRKFT